MQAAGRWRNVVDNVEIDWSIRELADIAGTTVRTIHYYIAEGLLPPPQGIKRNASYGRAHLARLRLIGALRDEGLALSSIRQRLAPLTDEQAQEAAGELERHLRHGGGSPLTTLGLIEAVLATQTMAREDTIVPASAPVGAGALMYDLDADVSSGVDERSIPEAATPSGESASEYLNRVLRKTAAPASRPRLARVPPPSAQPLPRRPHEIGRPEAWYHLPVADGVELRVREDRYREAKGRFLAVVDALRETLRRYGLLPPDTDR
jgi:DNA-binding transcriptional MerR regulator